MATQDEARKVIAARSAAQKKASDEYHAIAAKAKPTPTSEECDLMRMGVLLDEKEHDGSPSQEEHVTRIMEARIPGKNPYETREMAPKKPAA